MSQDEELKKHDATKRYEVQILLAFLFGVLFILTLIDRPGDWKQITLGSIMIVAVIYLFLYGFVELVEWLE